MIGDKFLTQTYTISNHPIREYEELIQCKYVKALGEFLCYITHADKNAKIIYEHWANSIINTDVLSNWMFTPNFTHLKEMLCYDKNDNRSNMLRTCLVFDCFYLSEKTNRWLLEKSHIFLLRKIGGHFTEGVLEHIYGYFEGANNGSNIPAELIKHRMDDIEFRSKPLKKVLVVATMSAGKSTLINALIGNRINKVASTVCTNKIRLVYNKLSNEGAMLECAGSRYVYTENHKIAQHDSVENACVHFQSILGNEHLCLIDTPGVNFNGDHSHGEMTRNAIKANDYDLLLFVSNATQFLTDDDANILEFVIRNCKKKIIFCLNQCDRFKPKDDSINEMVEVWKHKLSALGNKSPNIVVISAYCALLLKENENKAALTEDEELYLELMKVKFEREYYHLDKYCTNSLSEVNASTELKHTGILNLETLIYEDRKY